MTAITEIIYELRSFQDGAAKKLYLEEHIKDIVDELLEMDENDRGHYIEKLLDTFEGTKFKGSIKKTIDNALSHKAKQESKNKIGEFSSVDWDELSTNKNNVFPTQDNLFKILLAAKRVKCIWDEMTASVYYTSIDWETTEPIFTLPGTDQHYHKHNEFHNTELQRKLNQNGFPTEHNWGALKASLQNVSKRNKFDFYKMWMEQFRGKWDGIDRINDIDNCFAIKYLGANKEQWSCSWARLLMLCLVWRCFSPGCHQRYYFVMEGEENIGKSHFCRVLVPENWYRSSSLSVREDIEHYYKHTYDKAVIEFAELGGTDKASVNLFKRVTTETHSTFRRLYGDDVYDYPKRNITILTTNESVYLRNSTGNTRPVILKSELEKNELIDIEKFKQEYSQILAQAIYMYDAGVDCYLNEDEYQKQNEQADERDITVNSDEYELVCDYFKDDNNLKICKERGVYLDLIYTHAMGEWDMTKPELMRRSRAFGAALIRYGFSKHSNKSHLIDGKIRKVWYWR